jgi:hypothetical protein
MTSQVEPGPVRTGGIMRLAVLSVALAATVLLASCATPYAPEGLIGGFDAQDLRPDVVRVRFRGNGYTSKETAQTYWLYRAAELTLEKGYAGFEILSDMQFARHDVPVEDRAILRSMMSPSRHVAIPSSPSTAAMTLQSDPSSRRAESAEERGLVRVAAVMFFYGGGGVSAPAIEGDIHLINRPFQPAPPKVFDARALKADLEAHVKSDKCGIGNICPHVHDYLFPKGKLQ